MSAKPADKAQVVISKRSKQFRKMLSDLPPDAQRLADGVFRRFLKNPADPSLDTKALYDSKRGHHQMDSYSVRITLNYRAVYVIDNGKDGKGPKQFYWYWIGSREQFSGFAASR